MTPGGWIGVEAAMAHLAIWRNRQAFVRAVKVYGIPYQKVGRSLVFQRSRLDAWLKTRTARLERAS